MLCNHCGHDNLLGSNFCSSCGATLNVNADDPATVTLQIDAVAGPEEVAIDLNEVSGAGVLVVTRGPNAGTRFVIDAPTLRVGRHPESDIFLDDVTVSRHHVDLTRNEAGSYDIRDVGSLNGTYLNRERIEQAVLNSGDELQIGKFKLVYLDGSGTA